MEELKENLDKILDICSQKLCFEDYEKIFHLYLSSSEIINNIEEWWYD